jgi:hypothetical protein
MIKKFKKIFSPKEKENIPADPPGRTFKKVLVGEYFLCEKEDADQNFIDKSKQDKIDKIRLLELKPKFVRFAYKKENVVSAHVSFQKEIFAEKWNMIHITDLSFTVRASHFEEFESMAAVSLKKDFKDLTEIEYEGEERRKTERSS